MEVKRWKRQPRLRLVRARLDAAETEPVSKRRVRRRTSSLKQALRGVIMGGDILAKPEAEPARIPVYLLQAQRHPSYSDRDGRAPCLCVVVDGLNLVPRFHPVG